MERTLSPRELGTAIGASESSIKRWIDSGRLAAQVTSGGHRRIELQAALRFLQTSRRRLVDPALLGLTEPDARALADPLDLGDRLYDHLRLGRRDRLEQDLLAVLTMGLLEPAELFDVPLRGAFERIGELWHGADEGIYVEHRATVALLAVLDRLHALYEVPDDAPLAVGGSITGDPSLIPTRMVAIVLARLGYRTVDLGASTPAGALLDAARQLDAGLVWLSVSYADEALKSGEQTLRLLDELDARGVPCVLGGREVHRLDLPAFDGVRISQDLRDLGHLADDARRSRDD